MRFEIDETGQKWICCDLCDVTEADFDDEDPVAELVAMGWIEKDD